MVGIWGTTGRGAGAGIGDTTGRWEGMGAIIGGGIGRGIGCGTGADCIGAGRDVGRFGGMPSGGVTRAGCCGITGWGVLDACRCFARSSSIDWIRLAVGLCGWSGIGENDYAHIIRSHRATAKPTGRIIIFMDTTTPPMTPPMNPVSPAPVAPPSVPTVPPPASAPVPTPPQIPVVMPPPAPRTHWGLVLVILLLAVTAYGAYAYYIGMWPFVPGGVLYPSPSASVTPLSWQMYTSSQYGFTMQIPTGWKADEQYPGSINFISPEIQQAETINAENCSKNLQNCHTEYPFADIAFVPAFDVSSVHESTTVRIGSMDFLRYTVLGSVTAGIHYKIEHGGHVYNFEIIDASREPLVRNILATLQFTK